MDFRGVPCPQIIRDIPVYEYQVEMNKIPLLQRHPLTAEEATLGIDKLMRVYPCVYHTSEDEDEEPKRYLPKPQPEGPMPS